MGIAFRAAGTKTNGSGSVVSPPLPTRDVSTIGEGDIMVACRAGWSTAVDHLDETGWTAQGELEGGVGSSADAHVTEARGDTRVAQSGDGTPAFDAGGTVGGLIAIVLGYMKSSPRSTWSVATTTADDNTHAANRSTSGAGSISWQVGDVVIAIAAVDTDAALTITAQSFTATNVTFGTATRRTPATAGSTAGQDGNIEVFDAIVTGVVGTPTTAPSLSFTTVTAQCGPVTFIRLREVAASSTGKDVAIVVADKTAPTTSDVFLRDCFAFAGHSCTYVSDEDSVLASQDLHVIGESGSPTNLGTKYRNLDVPVLSMEVGGWDDQLWTTVNGANVGSANPATYDLLGHASLSGLPDPLSASTASAARYANTIATEFGAGVEGIASPVGFLATYGWFAYDIGDALVGGTLAAARQAGMGIVEAGWNSMSYDGMEATLQIADWLMAGVPPGPPATQLDGWGLHA